MNRLTRAKPLQCSMRPRRNNGKPLWLAKLGGSKPKVFSRSLLEGCCLKGLVFEVFSRSLHLKASVVWDSLVGLE